MIFLKSAFVMTLALFFGAAFSEAKTHVIINSQTTLYCEANEKIIKYALSKGYLVTVIEDHKDSTACYTKTSDLGVKVLVAKTHQELKNSLELVKMEVQKGDQVLFVNHAHGLPNKSGELTHSVLIGQDWKSFDWFANFRDSITSKGPSTLFALLTGSCFSGNELAFANSQTCVLTAQDKLRDTKAESRKEGTFIAHLFTNQGNSSSTQRQSLFSRFMSARNSFLQNRSWSMDRPQISSSAVLTAMKVMDRTLFDLIKDRSLLTLDELKCTKSTIDLAFNEALKQLTDVERSVLIEINILLKKYFDSAKKYKEYTLTEQKIYRDAKKQNRSDEELEKILLPWGEKSSKAHEESQDALKSVFEYERKFVSDMAMNDLSSDKKEDPCKKFIF